jgi:type I restriction enzyme S subunit
MTWPRVQVRRVAKLGTGHTPSRQHPEYWENCTIPWLTLADVWQLRDGTKQFVADTAEHISELGLANSAAVLHPAGTVALSRTASVGFSCILAQDTATSQDFATWTCGPRLLPKFLLWALRGTIDEIRATTMGSTHKTIYMPDIEQIRVPMPPVEMQEAIAEFLDAETARIDALVEKKRRMIALVGERARTITDEVLWSNVHREIPLMHLVQPQRPVMYGIVLPGPDVGENGIPIVKGGDVGAGLTLKRLARTTPEIERPYARARLRLGDLLFAIRGGVGDATIVPPELEDANITQDVARVAPGAGVSSEWLLHVLRSRTFQRRARELVRGATITGLNIRDLERVRIPWADRTRQEADLAALRPPAAVSEGLSRRLERQIDLLREHRQALITAAVTGQLDVAKAAA